ncbi:hypothetical protein LB507_009541 [Fusarium sp. FIESC RH6]|nr:hypothetical protein LB507_009541 [Fusarium sp. FIESC RH6]
MVMMNYQLKLLHTCTSILTAISPPPCAASRTLSRLSGFSLPYGTIIPVVSRHYPIRAHPPRCATPGGYALLGSCQLELTAIPCCGTFRIQQSHHMGTVTGIDKESSSYAGKDWLSGQGF